MSNNIGPSLPSHLLQKKDSEENQAKEKDTIGPALPPWLQKREESQKGNESDSIDPALPPWLKQDTSDALQELEKSKNEDDEIGPALPQWLKDKQASTEKADDSFGPPLPPGFQQPNAKPTNNISRVSNYDHDEPIIGPLPPSEADDNLSSVAEQFEKRSKKMKDKLEGREEPKKLEREEWMTELPPLLQGFGTGPRKFRAKEKNEIGDRSVWTETPADKAKKAAQGVTPRGISDEELIKQEAWAKRDAEIAKKLSDKSSSERGESLLNLHEKARKRKLKEEKESGEANIRRPFDRELDLQTNRFDDAAKKRFIKKTQGLSSRFSSSSTTSKFL